MGKMTIALMFGSLATLASGLSNAANPLPVVVTNAPSAPVPVSGTVAVTATSAIPVSGAVSVSNTAASPLYTAPAGAASTALLAAAGVIFQTFGTLQTQSIDVSKCSQIRVGISTTNEGNTVEVNIFNEQNMQLDQFLVGTVTGGNTINTTRTYDVPGVAVHMWLTPQDGPTGVPVKWALWCR